MKLMPSVDVFLSKYFPLSVHLIGRAGKPLGGADINKSELSVHINIFPSFSIEDEVTLYDDSPELFFSNGDSTFLE